MIRLLFATTLVFGIGPPPADAQADGDPAKGRDIAIQHCARCHVIGDFNRLGGIGSTPSFPWMANNMDDYVGRLQSFFLRRPHPVFVRVPGTPPPTNLPSYAAEFTMNPEDIENVVAFVRTLKTP